MKPTRYSEFFTYIHFSKESTRSQIQEFIEEELMFNEAQVTSDESGDSELLNYKVKSDIIDWYFSDNSGNKVKKANSLTDEGMYRVYFSRIILSDYQGANYYLEDWSELNDYLMKGLNI